MARKKKKNETRHEREKRGEKNLIRDSNRTFFLECWILHYYYCLEVLIGRYLGSVSDLSSAATEELEACFQSRHLPIK